MIRFICQVVSGLLLLTGSLSTTAQVFDLESTTDNSLIKPEAWRFHAGDSTGWSARGYDYSDWVKISPRVALSDNSALWQTGRGWFRRPIQFQKLTHERTVMVFRQFGRSEVYLDGRRLTTLRPFAFDSGGSQRITAFIPLPVTDTSQHQLAVRYAFRHDALLGRSVSKVPFKLDFNAENRAANDLLNSESTSTGVQYLLTTVFGLLSLLHFLFYRANSSQRVNLILTITMLAFALIFLLDLISVESGTLTLDSLLETISWAIVYISLGLLLLSLYTYLHKRPGLVFWGVILVSAALAVSTNLFNPVHEDRSGIPFVLVLADYIRVSWLAKRRNPDPEARLPWNSLKFSLYSFLAIIVLVCIDTIIRVGFDIPGLMSWLMVPMVLLGLTALFSIPIGLSFSLVGDYARTYQSLREQFDAVNRLSAKTLAQEQEKQLILASQNEELEKQVADRTAELNQSLTELRNTQTQLIQREKLASLGELTAGIAHEIQNPLNFVNNFSEVSTELVAELAEEAGKPDRDTDLEAELLADLSESLKKITNHGRRAASIVKGMLEHSRSTAGEKQLTDLNALAEEYLHLAYHAIRTKQPDFNIMLITHFDADPGSMPAVAQEIGRVLLNLFSNAFYALQKRHQAAEPGYKPTLRVSTQQVADEIIVQVWDNGTGIPVQVQQKIFQPFFTTKPSGEGTGLGLSLSYDIITKGYGGTLSLQTEEGRFTEFTVTLPCS